MKSVTISGPVLKKNDAGDMVTVDMIMDQFNAPDELCSFIFDEARTHSPGLEATWTNGKTEEWPTLYARAEIISTKQANW